MVGLIAVLLVLVVLGMGWGAVAVTRHRAASAADLAALAAAAHLPSGERVACERARWVADQMRVELRDCRPQGWEVQVVVAARLPGPFAVIGATSARARAGPAET